MEAQRQRSNCDYARSACIEEDRDDGFYSNHRQYAAEVPLLAKFLGMPQTSDPSAADLFVVPYLDSTFKTANGEPWGEGGGYNVTPHLTHLSTHRSRHVFLSSKDMSDVSRALKSAAAGALLLSYGPTRVRDVEGGLDVVVPPNSAAYGEPLPPSLLPVQHLYFANMGEINYPDRSRRPLMDKLHELSRRHPEWNASVNWITAHRYSKVAPATVSWLMRSSLLCPIAAGDLPYQHRLYDAMVFGCVPLFIHNGDVPGRQQLTCERWYGDAFPECMDQILPFWDSIPFANVTYTVALEELPAFLENTPVSALLATRKELHAYAKFFWYNQVGDASEPEDAFSKLVETLCTYIEGSGPSARRVELFPDGISQRSPRKSARP
jgi:hypothetical protein